MYAYEFSYSEIIGETKETLQYYAGKRAGTAGQYNLLTICECDSAALNRMLEQTLAEAAVSLSPFLTSSALRAGSILIELWAKHGFNIAEPEVLRPLLKRLLVCGVIRRWLQLSGDSEYTQFQEEAAALLELIRSKLNINTGLTRRRVPPL